MEYSVLTREDTESGLLAPDIVTPTQFSGLFTSAAALSGEHRLLAAVLQDGIETFQKFAFSSDPNGRALFSEALRWVSDPARDDLFSYGTICDSLDINAENLKKGLLTWFEENRHTRIQIHARHLDDPRRRIQRAA
jgi:hypothetical protein